MAGRRPLLTVAQVAERFALTEHAVRRMVHERRIPFRKLGPTVKAPVRFDPDELDRWEQRFEVAS